MSQKDFTPQPHRHPGPVAGCKECERESFQSDKQRKGLLELAGYCWLIEKRNGLGQPLYWTGRNFADLTDDPYSALRFHSKEDAERIYMMCVPFPCHVVEHHFAVSARGEYTRLRGLIEKRIKGMMVGAGPASSMDGHAALAAQSELSDLLAAFDAGEDDYQYVGEKK